MKNRFAAVILTAFALTAGAEEAPPSDRSIALPGSDAPVGVFAGARPGPALPETGTDLPAPPAADSATSPAEDAATAAEVMEDLKAENIWDRIRAGFRMDEIESPLVARHEAWYLNRPDYTQRMIERSRLYLHFIVEEVEKRGMPTEVALLPMIESAYNPNAYSRARASGIWQFIPSTGKRYGLQQDWWYDGRRDVIAATRAALDYLEFLHEEFDDWNLALAAYNWGENGVRRAIQRNKRARKPTTYYSLHMPRETRNYLPKLQAVKNIVTNPSVLSFALPVIPNQPYFTVVQAADHIDVEIAAQLAEMSVEEFVALNPGYNRPVITSNGNRSLLLPVAKATVFRTNLESYDQPLLSWQTYTIKKGESVESLAKQFDISPARLREINGISAGRPAYPGRTLLVPMIEDSEASNLADTWDNAEFQSPDDYYGTRIVHRVRKGETLSTIARRYRVSIAALKEWNRVRGTTIRAGQKLVIYRDPRSPQVSKMLQ
jgi:membrane-bound lytic murein transglycosylase D